MNKFWMVLADNSVHTTVRHPSFKAAKAESERLARLNPGVKFFVLGCEGFALKRDVDWVVPTLGNSHPAETIDDDEMPF